jgi:hypothetical protein
MHLFRFAPIFVIEYIPYQSVYYNVILNYCDFFLWGYVKDIVYKTPVYSLHELKLRIVATIETKCWRTLGGKLNNSWTSFVQ